MHSTIFQITKTRVEKENFLNEDTLMQGDNSHFDYCAEMDDKVRKEEIDYLVNHILPKGMFELTSEDTILYKGGADKWKEDFVSEIRKKAEAITPDKVQDWIGPVYQLEKFLKDPLDTGYWKIILQDIDLQNVSFALDMPLDSLSLAASLDNAILQIGRAHV